MSRSLHEAYLMQDKHQKILAEYTATFPKDLTNSWKEHIEKWNQDHSIKPDPYEEIETRKYSRIIYFFQLLSLIYRYFNERYQAKASTTGFSKHPFRCSYIS